MQILSDYHMHSHHSGDSTAPMDDMILSAIDKGLAEICFTEHIDLDYPDCPDLEPGTFDLDIGTYRNELFLLRDKYKDRIAVRFGIEIGMQPQIAKENLSAAASYDFDFIIASQHLVGRKDPFYAVTWEGRNTDDILRSFFEETLENIRLFQDFDCLGHLDYIVRYVPKGDTAYSYERYKDLIDTILMWLIENGKGLDVNSKVLSKDLSLPPNPGPEILMRYKELGGELITFGSDAHRPQRIACGYKKMREIALACGFSHYFTFENRTPISHKL